MATETLQINITGDNKSALAAFNQVQKSAFNLKEEIRKYEELAFTEKSTAKVAAYNRRIQELQVQLKQIGNVGKAGFDEIGNAAEKSSKGFTKAFTSVRQLAYILPGIGIAGLFNLAFDAIGKGATALGIFNTKLTETQKQYAVLNEVNKETDKQAGKEIANLQLLYKAATDHNLSIHDRLKAAETLKSQYPEILGNLSAEKIAAGGAADAYKKLTENVIANARVSAVASKIGELEAQRLEANANKEKIIAVTTLQIKTAKSYNTGGEADATISKEEQILNATNRRNKALQVQDDILKNIDATENLLLSTVSSKAVVDTMATDTKTKSLKEQVDLLKELRLYIDQNGKLVDKYSHDPLGIKRASVDQPGIQKGSIPGKLDPKSGIFGSENAQRADNAKRDTQDLTKDIQNLTAAANLGSQAVGNLFDDLLKGQNIGEALGNVFGDLATNLAKAALEAATFSAIMSLIPGAGLLGGGGKSGGGGGFFGLFKSILGFSNGGMAKGPKSGHMELLHGDEWVLRPDQLNGALAAAQTAGSMSGGMGQGNGGGDRLVTEISGTNLRLLLTRTDTANEYRR